MADLSVMLGNVRLKNPIVSAAGPIAGTTKNIKKCADAGFGAVICKTTTYFSSFRQYPRPRYYIFDQQVTAREPHSVKQGEFSWMHLDHNSSYPPDKFVDFVKESASYCAERDCLLVGSFAGAGVQQWEQLAVMYAEAGAKALELNFCCPYPQDMPECSSGGEHKIGATFGENPDLGVPVIERLKKAVNIPIFTKMPPTVRKNVATIAKKYKDAGADGITTYANSMVLKIDIETGEPLGYGVAIGGSHGHMMDTLADVAKIAKEVPGITIKAGRGARYWTDAIEFLMAGASAIDYSIAIMVNGLGYVNTMLTGMEKWMDKKGYKSIAEFQGIALPKIYKPAEIKDKTKPLFAKVDGLKCAACGRCEDVCVWDAAELHVKKGKGAAKIVEGHCVGCGACQQVCLSGAITMHERSEEEYLKALVSSHPDFVAR